MSIDYLPSREAELVTWAQNFNTQINTDPTVFGLSIEQAVDFNTVFSAFNVAYTAAQDPATRSPVHVETKNEAKKALLTLTRELVAVVQAFLIRPTRSASRSASASATTSPRRRRFRGRPRRSTSCPSSPTV